MSELGGETDRAILWRRLTDTLWVGLGPDGVVGCIEIGRRCVVTDGEGHVFGRFRQLDNAKAMLTMLGGAHAAPPPGGGDPALSASSPVA